MKNVVMGLFDRLEDAESVIAQLVASPLDLESIQVIHADTAIQRRLGLQAGLPARRAVRTGAVLGALLGAAIGFSGGGSVLTDGTSPAPLASLGPLLAMSVGAMLGLLLGFFAGAVSDRLRIPGGHAAEVAEAIDAGATAVTVRTENLPTAKAIGDLFQHCGSKVLRSGLEASAGQPQGSPEFMFAPALDASGSADPDLNPDAASVPEAHTAFAPPWRREDAPPSATWLDADTAERVHADPTPSPSGTHPTEPSVSSASISASPGGPASPTASTGLPALDGDLLFPSASPALAPDQGDSMPRTIRRGETVSTPDRTTQALQPREHRAPRSSAAGVAEPSSPAMEKADSASDAPSSIDTPSPANDGARRLGLDSLGLSPRVQRSLNKAGIQDVAALRTLATKSDDQITALPGIGPAALNEVKRYLDSVAKPASEMESSASASVLHKPKAETKKPKPSSSAKREAPRSKPVPQTKVDKAAQSVLREIFGSTPGQDS